MTITMNAFRNSYGYMGFTELGGAIVIVCAVFGTIFLIALLISVMPETPMNVLIETHKAFAGLDCELMRGYITSNSNAHNHELLIYAERCL